MHWPSVTSTTTAVPTWALMGEDVLQVFHQKPIGGLAKPTRLVHGIKNPGLLMTTDLNGDGRDDLAIGSDEDQYGMYVCFQDAGGALSALRRVKVPDMRSMTFAKADGGDDLLAHSRRPSPGTSSTIAG